MLSDSLMLRFHSLKLNAAHAYVLARIQSEGALHPNDFIGEEKLNRHEVTRRLRELRQKNLLERQPVSGDDDARSFTYDLTPRGKALLEDKKEQEPAHA